MRILVTGVKGFIGRNLITQLKNSNCGEVFEYDIGSSDSDLEKFTSECEFIFHLAGVNRPKSEEEFMQGNFGFTSKLLDMLKKKGNKSPILITSSIQAELDNAYGKSKKASEELMFEYQKETGSKALVYRLPNVFGKWCRPNYNSAVATFCNNVAKGLPITVNDRNVTMNLVYIDDVVEEFLNALKCEENKKGEFCYIPIVHTAKLGDIVDIIESFKRDRETMFVPNLGDLLVTKLYSTYLTYLGEKDFSYFPKMNIDERGSFTEILKSCDKGQVSVNISKRGITKGNHWHNSKNEKFLVVSGRGVIRFRKIDENEVIEYFVSGEKLEIVDIPPGYTHNIENLGDTDMVTIMWANELFNVEKPDTYFLKV